MTGKKLTLRRKCIILRGNYFEVGEMYLDE